MASCASTEHLFGNDALMGASKLGMIGRGKLCAIYQATQAAKK
jgi:hypothetical protein